jgi:hypothetical protein
MTRGFVAELEQTVTRCRTALITGEGGAAQDTPFELLDFVVGCLPGLARILKAIAAHYPNAVPNETAASEASYSATSSSYANPRSALKTKDPIGYPEKDHVRAADRLFTA